MHNQIICVFIGVKLKNFTYFAANAKFFSKKQKAARLTCTSYRSKIHTDILLVDSMTLSRRVVTDANRAVLCQSGGIRLWLRPCHRAIPLWRHGDRASVADGKAVRRRSGGSHDYPRPCGHHRRVHWLPYRGTTRRHGGRLGPFLPCHLFTVIPAPYFKKHGKLPAVVAFVDGITAAAIGAITGSVMVIAKRSITDIPTALIALITVTLLWRFKKLQEPVIIVAAAAIRLVLYPLPRS